jgi:hypothetical protein
MTLSADESDQLRRLEESLWRVETRFDRDHTNKVPKPTYRQTSDSRDQGDGCDEFIFERPRNGTGRPPRR